MSLSIWIDATRASTEQLERAVASAAGNLDVLVLTTVDPDFLNDALAASSATHLLWLDARSSLTETAVSEITAVIERFDVGLLYGDSELSPAMNGERSVRRPAFSPIRLRAQDYLGDVRVFDVHRLRALAGFRESLHQSYDVAVRIAETGAGVIRVPSELARGATTARTAEPRLIPTETGNPLVSIIIPTRGSRAVIAEQERTLVVEAIRGIRERSTYSNVEFVIVADEATPQLVIDQLREVAGQQLKLVRWSDPFNFSAKINRGAVFASGEYLLLLNDDVELITPDWIETMLGLVQQPGVGMVGAMLYFEDGTIQHGGHLYRDSWAGHIAWNWNSDRDDVLRSLSVDREVSGVTAACALVSADSFWSVGGLSNLFAGNYNDVDFSLKIRESGASIMWTPRAKLFHFESKTRDAAVAPSELATLRRRWGRKLVTDPYWP